MSLLSDKDYISFKSIDISFIEIDKNAGKALKYDDINSFFDEMILVGQLWLPFYFAF